MQLFQLSPLLGFLMIGSLIGLLTTIFWIWMIVDCITNNSINWTQKIVWLLV